MIGDKGYTFRKAMMRDLELLMKWQSRDHVREWWDADEAYDEDKLNDPRVERWIVQLNGAPFAFMQDYTVHGWEEHHFSQLPKGSRGIDQFIGEPEMIGQGHGTAFMGNRMETLFVAGAPVIVTDPHPNNERAIAVYKKLGFQVSGPPQETEWGVILPMQANRQPKNG